MEPPSSSSSLPIFTVLVAGTVLWVTFVVILLPRILGRGLSFFANRTARGASNIRISTLHLYPLAGRIVAHSIRYTIPNGTFNVEELVLQIRWWRKAPKGTLRHLSLDDAKTLDPLAAETHELDRENAATFVKRIFFRLKRWWKRTALVKDPVSAEPPPLISLIAVGLRARIVNIKANYQHVNRVLELAKSVKRDGFSMLDVPLSNLQGNGDNIHIDSSGASSSDTDDAKPFSQHLAESFSLRISSGAFYFCDMGESPLVRVNVGSAKLRYRYGAPACSLDECRKRFRIKLSGLRICVADKDTVSAIVAPGVAKEKEPMEDNTDRMIKRVIALGYRGIADPHALVKRESTKKRPRAMAKAPEMGSSLREREKRNSFRYRSRQETRESRRKQPLLCTEILFAETAIVDYVFDEPGPNPGLKLGATSRPTEAIEGLSEGHTEDPAACVPPVCKVSILLRGSMFSYDTSAIANVERVLERLQPAFYDLMPLAMKVQSLDGKRTATGIQIEIDATPVDSLPPRDENGKDSALVIIPFDARHSTWKALSALNVRRWPRKAKDDGKAEITEAHPLPASALQVHAKRLSLRTEIPYRRGAQQKTIITAQQVDACARGVTDIPICQANSVTIVRVLNFPQIWNDVHYSTVDVVIRESSITFLPDTLRIIDDLGTTIREKSKKPALVRYFVPSKETVKLRAEGNYEVNLVCSHDNSWEDINAGRPDDFGMLKVCGENAELVLMQGKPTEFLPHATVSSWTLSLPNAVGQLEIPITRFQLSDEDTVEPITLSRLSDSDRSLHHKHRTTFRSQRVRGQSGDQHHEERSGDKTHYEVATVKILQFGKTCKLTGKTNANEVCKHLGSYLPTFLDSVDRSDISFRAPFVVFDYNPHHISNILGLIRNYVGGGNHSLSTTEKDLLNTKRREVATSVLEERRYPTPNECFILGLGAGQAKASLPNRKAMDELFGMTFFLDQVVVRLHDLPHAFSPFSKNNKNVCTIECSKFFGSLRSSRMGLELRCGPETERKSLTLHGGYRDIRAESQTTRSGSASGKLPYAVTTIEKFEIWKRSTASPDWGSHFSELVIIIGNVSGCILDLSTVCLTRVAVASIPHQLFENQAATAALLSVDNIAVRLGKADILVLSTSSNAYAERSEHASSPSFLRSTFVKNRAPKLNQEPRFLTGVTHLRVPFGLRFCLSSRASESIASRSRLLIPDVAIDVLISWGGRLTPWVDEETLRVQVAHAVLVRGGDPQGGFQDGGLLRRAAEIRGVTFELVLESRPRLWSQNVEELQQHHISHQREKTRGAAPAWYSSDSTFAEASKNMLSALQELELVWWMFLQRSCKAAILKRETEGSSIQSGKMDTVSIRITTNALILVSPESLELANDIVLRSKEDVSNEDSELGSQTHNISAEIKPERIFSSDVRDMWYIYEASRPPDWTLRGKAVSGTAFRALEMKGLKILLLSPLLPGENRHTDPLLPPESANDTLEVSFPFGIHLLEHFKTELLSVRAEKDARSGSYGGKVLHNKMFHLSVPEVILAGNDQDVCLLHGIVFISKEHSNIVREQRSEEQSSDGVTNRNDKHTIVCRVKSIDVGRRNSRLEEFACFGRIASIFVLMMRAVFLENSSALSTKNARIERICQRILSVSLAELIAMHSAQVRAFFAEISKQCVHNEHTQKGELKGTGFSDILPLIAKERATYEEQVQHGTVASVDLALGKLTLQLAKEDMITADNFVCKGGSTANAQTSSALEGHVVHASLGSIALSIRDDIAANTLRMISDVASFVRRATFSMPLLRYEAGRGSRSSATSSKLLSHSSTNEEYLKFKSAALLERSGISRDLGHPTYFPIVSHGSQKKTRAHWNSKRETRLRNPRAHVSTSQVPSLGAQAWSTKLHSSRNNADNMSMLTTNSQSNTHNVPSDADNRSEQRVTESSMPPRSTAQFRQLPDKRRIRPQSSNGFDQPFFLPRGTASQDEIFEENNQYFTYVAIPTAGEVGPPRKRSKSRVRVSTVVPPAFSNLERLSNKSETEEHVAFTLRPHNNPDLHRREAVVFGKNERHEPNTRPEQVQIGSSSNNHGRQVPLSHGPLVPKKRPAITTFVSCREILCEYFRRKSHIAGSNQDEKEPDLRLSLSEPRLTFMSSPSKGSHSLVVTATSAKLKSANDNSCTLTGSVESMGVKLSIAQNTVPSTLPKLIASARVSGFKTTLQATDLISVLRFRENFKLDLKAVLSAFVTTKTSIAEMARATRLLSSRVAYPGRSNFATMAFDVLFEDSKVRLQGFHPKDGEMCMSYLLDGLFFSTVASDDDKAALTLGIRLYGHGLALSSPSWPTDEVFHFPSLDARGVQWIESTGLPTQLKVSAEPLLNCTSIQGLRHVFFTVAGLMAFQNTTESQTDLSQLLPPAIGASDLKEFYADRRTPSHVAGATPFSRSFIAWERTKGVRMDLSIRPMCLSLVSGQVVALFQLEAVTGIFEWNKLVTSGVQLHTAVSIPKISLMFLRMPWPEFSMDQIKPNEHRASMSIALEKSRIDVLKTQEDLTHTFTFRVDIFTVSGQLRPWRLLLDAAVWADEQELASELQSINYASLSTPKPRTPRTPHSTELSEPLEHRIILLGANIQRFKLAVPLLNSEEYATSRLALRATELYILARKRFDNHSTPQKNILEVKSHFIGILWENSALFSSHHARITLGMEHSSKESTALFGAVNIVMVAGTWRICPRKDVVIAILEAKNKKDNKGETDRAHDGHGSPTGVSSAEGANIMNDALPSNAETQGRLLVENLRFKMLHTSGAIEGLDGDIFKDTFSAGGPTRAAVNVRSSESSTLTLPAFSVAMLRDNAENFDLIDIDFSGREGGEFPPKCLQKVSNLLTDLFGAVATDTQRSSDSAPMTPPQDREMSRDVSILIRFGKSMYKAQESVESSVESKFSFFAGRSSTMLLSLTTKPVFAKDTGHTTVMTGISPKLALEITPLIEGSLSQSLRLIDARFHHGVNLCHSPQTLLHVSKVTALLDAKTLLLTKGRLNVRTTPNSVDNKTSSMESAAVGGEPTAGDVTLPSERNIMIVLGRSDKSFKSSPNEKSDSPQNHIEPDIRLQLKLPLKSETVANQVDLAVERLHVGFCRTRNDPFCVQVPLNVHVALHEVNLRGLWDILSCRLRLQENLLSVSSSGVSRRENKAVVTNILNRLNFESKQFDNHTMKLAVDALATICSVPKRDVLFESTTIRSEISHTMIRSVAKMLSQVKKLNGEVRLLLEREMSRESKRNKITKHTLEDGRSADDLVSQQTQTQEDSRKKDHTSNATVGAGSSIELPTRDELLKRTGKRTRVYVKGDELSAILRGYQFEETRHSAVVSLSRYDLNYEYDCTSTPEPIHARTLGIDFFSMKMTYNDDGRAIRSDLFRAPSPKLRLRVTDTDGGLAVELLGDLELKLGSGFFYWQEFKRVAEDTMLGITPAQETEENEQKAKPAKKPELWGGRRTQVLVKLNPRIDVIGDLTNDVLQFRAAWMNGLRTVPKHLYDYVAIPIEKMSEIMCDSLSK